MEDIIAKLLVADNATIQQGTKELKEAFKNPEAVPALFQLIVSAANPQIRQTAAVLLRKKLGKRHVWSKVDINIRNVIKQGMLQALVNEPEKFVKNAVVQFIATIGKHEFPNNTWPEVLQFIYTLCNSESLQDKELGMYTLSIMTEMSVDQYINHADSFAFLFTNILTNTPELNSQLTYYTLMTMKHFATVIEGHQEMINVYHSLLPRVMECIKVFAVSDEKKACDVMELLDDLVETCINVVLPHTRPLVEMCLQLCTTNEIPDEVKVKAISFVGWLTRSKAKNITKNKLVEPIVDVLFALMCLKPDDDGDEEYFTGDPDSSNPMTCATQTLDLLALHIAADKLIPPVLRHIEPALQTNDLYAKKAAYLAMAVLAEGCSEHIRTKYLQSFLQCIGKGITDQNAVVRNAALFALGQFSEHLQPEISQYASDLLPVLFEFLSQMCIQLQNNGKEPASIDRMFYALEMFCENLDHEILPYLPTLMERLFFSLNPTYSIHLRELALSAIASAANAAKEELLPYFTKIIEYLKVYLTADPASDLACLQAQAVDTLGVIARTIGPENFKPLAQESLQLALNLVTNTDDPDIRKSAYGLFSSLATVMKGDIAGVLPQIIEQMIESIKSADGIVSHYKDDETALYEDLSDDPDEEDIEAESSVSDDEDVASYSVENAYVEEKEEACLALKEISEWAGAEFLPYLENCFKEIFKLINYPQEDIRNAAVSALLQFCITLSKVNAVEGREALLKALQMFIPKCSELIRTDDERSVVMCALDAYSDLLKQVGRDVLVGEGHREAIMNCVIDVMTYKTACQDQDQETEDTEDTDAEQDEILLECAGDIIPNFGKAIEPNDFVYYFPNILTLLQIRAKKQHSLSQRSLAVGTLAECMKPLGIHVGKFMDQLLPLLLEGSADKADEVRNNSIFAIGEMVLNGKEHVYPYYNKILQLLSATISKEKHAGTIDNICGALARMIVTNVEAIPINDVFPVYIKHLPLREDFVENEAVFKSLAFLYQQGNPLLVQHLPDIIQMGAVVLHKKQTSNEETKTLVVNLLKTVQQDFTNEFNSVVTTLPPDVSASLQALFQA